MADKSVRVILTAVTSQYQAAMAKAGASEPNGSGRRRRRY
jgi:hypothetical protein